MDSESLVTSVISTRVADTAAAMLEISVRSPPTLLGPPHPYMLGTKAWLRMPAGLVMKCLSSRSSASRGNRLCVAQSNAQRRVSEENDRFDRLSCKRSRVHMSEPAIEIEVNLRREQGMVNQILCGTCW